MALPTVEDVEKRLEEEVTENIRSMIQEGLYDALDLAQTYGNPLWDQVNLPDKVGRICARAVARWINNPDGLSQSRAADETLVWQDSANPGSVYFTDQELAVIQTVAQPSKVKGFGTISMTAWGAKPAVIDDTVPVYDLQKPMPFFGVATTGAGVGLG